MYVSEYFITLLSAQSWQYRDRRKAEVGTMPYSYRIPTLQGFFIVHSTIDSIAHSRVRILVQVTIYRRLLIGRDGYLDQ